jgi:hypothetical protein
MNVETLRRRVTNAVNPVENARRIRRLISRPHNPLPPFPDLRFRNPPHDPRKPDLDPVGAHLRPRKPEGSAGAALPIPKSEEPMSTRIRDRKIS